MFALSCCVASAAFADVKPFGFSPPPGLEARSDELDAWRLMETGHPIKAREAAEKIVKSDSKSFVSHFVIGQVQQYTEANFPRALYHYKLALAAFESKYGTQPSPRTPWRWHAQILRELGEAEGNLEHFNEKLAYIAKFNELYEPDMVAERAWPLMKLGRYREAKLAARMGLAKGDPMQVDWALNALCAIEFEAGNDGASYEACRAALDDARLRPESVNAVDLTNFAEASRSLFRLDEAERTSLEATKAAIASYGNPWIELAELYTREGRFPEALSALKEVHRYRMRRPPHVRDSDRNEGRRALSAFFVVVGHPEDALRITSKALVAPDRRAHNSRDPAQDRAIAALLDRRARRALAQQKLEQAVGEPFYKRALAYVSAYWLRFEGWMAGREAVKLLSDQNKLVGIFRIGTSQSAVIQPWLAGELSQVFGPGVVRQAVHLARQKDKRPGADAYYDAFEAEAAWISGEHSRAIYFSDRALKRLGPAEVLLRARVHAFAADSARSLGRFRFAASHYDAALQSDPGVFRRLDLAIPVHITHTDDALSHEAASLIDDSPRFEESDPGIALRIDGARNRARACLLGGSGGVVGCGEVAPKRSESEDKAAKRLVSELASAVFEPRVDLSQSDANSLDGSNRVSRNPLQNVFGTQGGNDPLVEE